MSKIKRRSPIIHTPSFKKWGVSRAYVSQMLNPFGLEPLYPDGVHNAYWYTDEEGRGVLLPDLLLKSDLYKDVFTCINYSFKVWNECSQRYGLNTWVPIIGRIPNYDPRHAWILIMVGDERGLDPDKFLYFEPNQGWQMRAEIELAYQAFPIGEEGYKGEFIFY